MPFLYLKNMTMDKLKYKIQNVNFWNYVQENMLFISSAVKKISQLTCQLICTRYGWGGVFSRFSIWFGLVGSAVWEQNIFHWLSSCPINAFISSAVKKIGQLTCQLVCTSYGWGCMFSRLSCNSTNISNLLLAIKSVANTEKFTVIFQKQIFQNISNLLFYLFSLTSS